MSHTPPARFPNPQPLAHIYAFSLCVVALTLWVRRGVRHSLAFEYTLTSLRVHSVLSLSLLSSRSRLGFRQSALLQHRHRCKNPTNHHHHNHLPSPAQCVYVYARKERRTCTYHHNKRTPRHRAHALVGVAVLCVSWESTSVRRESAKHLRPCARARPSSTHQLVAAPTSRARATLRHIHEEEPHNALRLPRPPLPVLLSRLCSPVRAQAQTGRTEKSNIHSHITQTQTHISRIILLRCVFAQVAGAAHRHDQSHAHTH